jgi:hypothetical protein
MRDATRAFWSKEVKKWAASGQTLREYAAARGVGASSLKNWKWQLGVEARRAAAAVKFVEVTAATASRAVEVFEVVLVDGTTVRVPAGFDAPELAKLVKVLSEVR